MEKELMIIGGQPWVAWSENGRSELRQYRSFGTLDEAREFMDFIDLMEVSNA